MPMKNSSPLMQLNRVHRYVGRAAAMVAALSLVVLSSAQAAPEKLKDSVLRHIQALQQEKANRTPQMLKMDSHLVHAVRTNRHENVGVELHPLVKLDADGHAIVDIDARVNPSLLEGIGKVGGTVDFSSERFHAIRARIPLSKLEKVADMKGVKFIKRAAESATRTGSVDSEGDITHKANLARSTFGADGSGVKVGVLSDSVDFLTQAQSTGDLPPNVTVLPNQQGVGAGEGTAMMEIVYDLAPGAQLFFATGFNSEASFAQNIVDLRKAGCDVIVDDIFYFDESPFQDGVVAQAVNTVTADGAIYFSAAGNEGNKDHNNSGTWEGDFVDGGAAAAPVNGKGGNVHSFGANNFDIVDQPGFATVLFWSDPAGASTNDYDLYVLDSTGATVINSSTTVQNGNQDPFEIAQPTASGQQIVVVKATGADGRFLHIDTIRGNLRINTAGNITGHPTAENGFGVAAVDQHRAFPNPFTGGPANPVETFSTDGPRRKFYQPDGTPYTAGDFSSTGGRVFQKPDIAAADGVTTTVPGFAPFYGTSAAAPHAAAICALLKSYNPNLDTNQIRTVLTSSALDNERVGFDRDSGAGIVMALEALTASPVPVPTPNLNVTTNILSGGNGNGIIDPDECNNLDLVITNRGNGPATAITATLSTTTPGVIVALKSVTYPDLAPGQSSIGRTPFKISTTAQFICGTPVDLTVIITSTEASKTNTLRLSSGILGAPFAFANNIPLAIPDANPVGVDSPMVVSNIVGTINKVTVSLYLNHTFDSDLELDLIAPDNTRVILSQFNGGAGHDYGASCASPVAQCTFDDNGGISIAAANPPYVGTFIPQQPLSTFNLKGGTNVNGTWKLHVSDNALLDVGTLNCWKLNIYPAICTDGGGECPGSDLSVTMSDNPDPVLVTSNLTYTMVVSNAGPATAKSVVLNQTLPPTVQFLSASNTQGVVTQALNTVTANLGVIPVFGTATVAVTVVPLTNGIITSTANVGSPAFDSDTSNNSATSVTRVEKPTADVALTMTGSPNPALDGGTITYTVTVTNNGPFTATGVVVTNLLPLNSVFVSASTSQGTFANAGGSVLALLGNLTTGMTATVTFIVAPTSTGIATATAQVAEDSFITDPLPGNNRATVSTTVNPAADVAVTAVASPQQALLGSNVTYTITVTNRGPDSATGVVLNDILPSGSTLVSATSTRGTVTTSPGNVSVTMGSMAPGDNGIVTVVIKAPSVSTTMLSLINVSSAQPDPNLLNNSLIVRTIVSPPFIRLVAAGATMTAENFLPRNGIVDIGETVTLQFALQNTGNAVASAITATLLSTGGVTSPSGVQNYGSLGSGDVVSEPFTFTANGANGGTLTATLQLQTNGINAGTVTYTFSLPNTSVFSNTNAITIVDATVDAPSAAIPYPSTIQVSGVTGFVSRVSVSLSNLSHTYPDDIGSLVVHPSGRTSVLMAHAGGGLVASHVNLTFDRGSSDAVPDESQLTSARYAPAAYGSAYAFPTNFALPVGPYAPNLAGFEGTDPNGNWLLFVADDSRGDSGNIAGGWSVAVTTGTPVSPIAELSVNSGLLGNAQNSVLIGNNVTFEVVIKNNGPFDATGVLVTNVLSSGLSLVSVTTPPFVNYTANGQTIIFSAPTLAFGSNLVLTIVAQSTATGIQTDTIGIGANELDINLQDNTAVQAVVVNPLSADLGLSATASVEPVTVGSNLVYNITVTNRGPNAALNTMVTDVLPAGFNFVGATSSQGSASINSGTVTIALGTMAPNAVATAAITFTSAVAGTVTNAISVTTSSADSNLGDNSVSIVSTVVQPIPVLVATGIQLISESGPVNGAVDQNETVSVAITLSNIGNAPTTNPVAVLLTNGGVVPIVAAQQYGSIPPGGRATRTFTFVGTQPPGGTNVATLALNDGGYNYPWPTFSFIVPSSNTYSNGSAITIPSAGPASPYPATITIANVPGVVSKAVLNLSKVNHTFPRDINVLLVSPTGQSVLALSHCGGAHSLTNVNITIDDAGGASMSSSNQITSGTYLPSVYSPVVSFPGITAPPTGPSMSALNGSSANGTWSLYVLDDNAGDAGSIGGWSLALTVANTVSPAAALSLTMSGGPASVLTGNFVDYVVTVANAGPSTANNVVIADTLPLGVSLVSSSIASGTTDLNGNILNCRLPSLAPGASASAFIRVQAASVGSITNTATVSADTTDIYSVDNYASVVSTVTQAADAHMAGAYLNGTGYRIVLTGQNGEPYIVQFSTNLTSWSSISTNTPVNGTFTITDSAATSSKTRYYRAFRAPH